MNKAVVERSLVVVLFLLVLVLFSFADRDSKKLQHLYSSTNKATGKLASFKSISNP